ncbi:WD repeat-containing protein 66 [Trachymyrmex septentrionalis]|uniref:Cilia- and flagella-associated protein 251 n=1 Tax=Trachymyrmex septentrionalis TaxID=34720 RepID=A0A195EQ42_9HYME|nr:PREDICTED: WD repeat-containing protein 66-like isoform X2 [Trachymyrmex septentrionalis]KYN30405.1 WD repeat-containing protein 66 [Trachymyrmex septentrionalis]
MKKIVSQTKITEDTENTEITAKKKCLERGFTEGDLCPFKLKWSFGLNPEVPIINLTTTNRTLLAYACSHIAIIYDYDLKKMLPLLSHRNPIKMLSTSRDGKWLLTADSGKDSVVVIWDTEQGVSVCTLFNPHNSEDITVAAISPNAKQIVTVGGGKCQNVHFWLWTYRRDKPDASTSLINIAERVKGITFNDKCPEQFALTTDYHVLFLTWNGHVLSYDCPKVMAKVQRIGVFNASCYVPEVQQAFTASTNGYVLVWDNVSCKDKHASDDTNYKKKKHRKTLNLQKSSITVIIDNEGVLVTGNSNGRVTFYDYQLRFLYWCESYHLDSIRWLSFHLESDLLAPLFVTKRRHLPSKTQIDSKLIVNAEAISQDDKSDKTAETIKTTLNPLLPSVTLQCSPFNIRNFLVCSSAGIVALMKIPMQKCYFVFHHPVAIVTSMDSHPERSYMVVGDAQGTIHLYNHEKCILLTSKSTPPLPNYRPILEKQKIEENIIYVTCPQSHKTLKAVTTLKFSPRCDMLVCGLENGAIWILHHITLDPIDEIPYKHSSTAINKIIFTRCAEYMAYTDNALTVVVFKRNHTTIASKYNMWNLIGKYHSHYLPIRDILFGPATSDSDVPRFFSLGEDRELVEYDLAHSGPYPVPGLKILRIDQIEQSAVPLCLAWYPVSGIEKFLMISNSEYKYKIFNDATKTICGTYLGPTFEKPVKYIQILTDKVVDHGYMVYATDREIGLQLMPLDGNPYKIVGITGHPQKIIGISVSHNKEILFTAGYNDPCVLMWKIQLKSVDKMARLGGAGLSPFYCLIKGGKKGWLANEMKAQFYYAQILHQGENTTDVRIISDTVDLEQISNLMRAIGYFPTNKEVENIMTEVWYKQYVETGKLIEKITFEEFVRLYVNHRPVFGIGMRHIKEAFRTFIEENADSMKNPTLTREQLVDILGGTISKTLLEEDKPIGEMLTLQEAYTYLKTLMFPKEEMVETQPSLSQRFISFNFRFLPARISYKDFIMDIVGVESLEETMADN